MLPTQARMATSARPVVVTIWRCPSEEKTALAAQIRRSGADVPADLRPKQLGQYKTQAVDGPTATRLAVKTLAEQHAKTLNARIRSMSATPQGWVVYLAVREK
ncbi:MAG: hypothetical protein E6R03_03855 [Hyphomicrobiaceae bacterium]|nr:MAG: hypothetical protein E6R03_03855 [Hyphomicrobiaceae bacterium]